MRTQRWEQWKVGVGMGAFMCVALVGRIQASGVLEGESLGSHAVALAVSQHGEPVQFPIVVADTGALPSGGGRRSIDAGKTNFEDGAISVGRSGAMAEGTRDVAGSTAYVNNIVLRFLSAGGITNVVSAENVRVLALAESTELAPNTKSLNGVARAPLTTSSHVYGLRINGEKIEVGDGANQVFQYNGWKLVVNQRTANAPGQDPSVTMIGMHVLTDDGFDAVVCGTRSGISDVQQVSSAECDEVAGGGWFPNTSCPRNTTFNLAAGTYQGKGWGHLGYKDPCAGLDLKTMAMIEYSVVDDATRQIKYRVELGDQAGVATVLVSDRGGSGQPEVFAISLSNGYGAGGEIGGGLIQIHRFVPSWGNDRT